MKYESMYRAEEMVNCMSADDIELDRINLNAEVKSLKTLIKFSFILILTLIFV